VGGTATSTSTTPGGMPKRPRGVMPMMT
jgi:hypothetical protein